MSNKEGKQCLGNLKIDLPDSGANAHFYILYKKSTFDCCSTPRPLIKSEIYYLENDCQSVYVLQELRNKEKYKFIVDKSNPLVGLRFSEYSI